MSRPDFEEFERARQEAAESLGQALQQLQRDPNGLHGLWLLDSLSRVDGAVTAARRFSDVAARVVDHAVPKPPPFASVDVRGMP